MTLATNTVFNVLLVLVLIFIENNGFSLLTTLGLPAWLDTLLVVILLDFALYFAHVVMHHVPVLWRFHRVHHSDSALDVTTTIRQHPMEGLIRYAFTAMTALAIGASVQAFAVYRVLSLLNALLEHADLRVGFRIDRALSWIVVTPNMHKVHHSRSAHETNSNYGNILSVFDRALATFTPTERGLKVAYGLDGFDDPAQQSTIGLLRSPFQPRLASRHEPMPSLGSADASIAAPSGAAR